MKIIYILAFLSLIGYCLGGVTVTGYGSSNFLAENTVGTQRIEDKIDLFTNEFELFIIDHLDGNIIEEWKMRYRSLVEYRDVGTVGNGYTSSDTLVREYTGFTWSTFSNLGSNQFGFGSTNSAMNIRGVVDTSATTLRDVVSANISSLNYSSLRLASDTSISLKFELVAIKKVNGGNTAWPEIANFTQVIEGFGSAIGYAELSNGSQITIFVSRYTDTSSGTDRKWMVYFSFGGAGTNVDLKNIMLWKSVAPVSTSGSLTTGVASTTSALTSGALTSGSLTSGELTTSPLTTSPLTTSEITSGSDVTTSEITSGSLTTGEVTTGSLTTGQTCMCPCECV